MTPERDFEFFQEGLRSYMDAMLALGQFRQEVQQKAEGVLRRNLQELGQALQVPLEGAGQILYVNPSNPSNFNGTFTWITTRLEVQQFRYILFGLLWLETEGNITLFVTGGFWFSNRRVRDKARQAFGGDSALWDDYEGLYLRERLTPEEAASFETKLDDVVKKWIELWRRVGGLNAVLTE